jgi:tRNA(Ile)-lysidine synthase
MFENMKDILSDDLRLALDQPVLVGVSGGPDSLCLLDVIERSGYLPIIAHFNHKLRPEADSEAEVIRRFAEDRDMLFVVGEADVAALAAAEKNSIEEAARNARYTFLFDQAINYGAQAVVVGHNADDQVETVLMHLLRGSGLSGLGGMLARALPNAWSENIPLVRPLLGIWRDQILEYCQEQGLEPVIDSTNEDRTYFRNRLRQELIPYLESYNPSIRKVIWRSAEVLRGDFELLDQSVDQAWQECFQISGPGYVAIDARRAGKYPIGVQRHLVRRAIAFLRPELRDIGFEAIESGRAYLHKLQGPAEVDLIAGLKLLSETGRLWVAEWNAELPTDDWPQMLAGESVLSIPGSIKLAGSWQLVAEKISAENLAQDQTLGNNDPYLVQLDLESIQTPLLVRARREGDRFLPFGMGEHSVKLSDFMINEKLPQRARQDWPLVCSGEQIAWVPGYRLAHPFRITDSTQVAVKLKLQSAA